AKRTRDRGHGLTGGGLRFAEEQQDEKEHREDAKRGDAKNGLEAEMRVGPAGDVGSGGAADFDHRVVGRIADAADVFFRGARGGADDARLDERDAERGENEDDADEESERYGVADRGKPACADGADEKVSGGENQIGKRKRAAKAETVGD